MVLVSRLAKRTGAVVLYTYVERLPGARGYRMHFLPAPDRVNDPDPVIAAGALNQGWKPAYDVAHSSINGVTGDFRYVRTVLDLRIKADSVAAYLPALKSFYSLAANGFDNLPNGESALCREVT